MLAELCDSRTSSVYARPASKAQHGEHSLAQQQQVPGKLSCFTSPSLTNTTGDPAHLTLIVCIDDLLPVS